jgi:hypothetical protein
MSDIKIGDRIIPLKKYREGKDCTIWVKDYMPYVTVIDIRKDNYSGGSDKLSFKYEESSSNTWIDLSYFEKLDIFNIEDLMEKLDLLEERMKDGNLL